MKLYYYSSGMNDTRVRVRREDWAPDAWELLKADEFARLKTLLSEATLVKFFQITLQDGDTEGEE